MHNNYLEAEHELQLADQCQYHEGKPCGLYLLPVISFRETGNGSIKIACLEHMVEGYK